MIVVAVLSLKDQWKQNDKMVRYYALAKHSYDGALIGQKKLNPFNPITFINRRFTVTPLFGLI
jgi:hypothetical protein